MLTIMTVFKSGGDYTKEYVARLRRGVAQHLEAEHRFVCLTDTVEKSKTIDGVKCNDASEYDEETGVEWIALENDYPGWWSKVEAFSPRLEKYGRILFLDLSCIPVGDLADIAAYDGPACITSDWYYGGPSQSVVNYAPGEMRAVWDLFMSDPEKWMAEGDKRIAPNFGDQILVNEVFGDGLDRWQDEFPGHVVSFREHCQDGVPRGARLVKFHGYPRIHECEEPWVGAAWKVGFRSAEYQDGLNTFIETIIGQVKFNSENQDVRWLRSCEKPKKHVCIVGGAPSLKDCLSGLKLRKRLGHTIWALNGTHDYLIENGIIPDASIIMDARPDNVKFLSKPHKRVEYMLASRVHPSLFDAVKGYNVTMWHSEDGGVQEYLEQNHQDKPWATVTGGGTVGLRAMVLAHILDFRFIHVYGMDSSYSEAENHAYRQTMNDGERVDDVFVGGKKFRSAPWMIRQVDCFQEHFKQLSTHGMKVSVHGEGLLPFVASLMGGTEESSFQ